MVPVDRLALHRGWIRDRRMRTNLGLFPASNVPIPPVAPKIEKQERLPWSSFTARRVLGAPSLRSLSSDHDE